MILSVDNVSKSFGARVLFKDARLRVGARDRIALVGPNGAGKTTLLDIIAGRQDADEGCVSTARDAVVGYLEQEAIEMAGRTVLEEALTAAEHVTSLEHRLKVLAEDLEAAEPGEDQERTLEEYGRLHDRFEALGGYTIESDARAVLFGLGFKEPDLERLTDEFSGGWQMRLALAKLLLRQPDVLLLDEPTNHLDLESVTWIEGFLRAYEGAIILVSHDRAFMENLVDHVAEIDLGKVTIYTGTYSEYVAARELALEQLKAAYEAQQKEIAHMEAFVERFRYKNTKSKQAQDRVKKLEKIERIVLPEARKMVKFRFPQPPRTGDLVIKLEGVSKAYGDNVVYENLDFALYRGDKVALVGPNGAGKSTLLKMLAGALEPDGGERELGHHVDVAYFAQHQLQALHLDNTVYQEVDGVAPGWTQSEVRSLLGAFLFKKDDVEKKVRVLSGGEKGRLALAKMLVKPAPLLCPGRADQPPRHHLGRRARAGAAALRGHDRAHHPRPAPDPRHREQDRRGARRPGHRLRRRLRLLPVQAAEREAAEKGGPPSKAAGSGRARKMGEATTATSTVVRLGDRRTTSRPCRRRQPGASRAACTPSGGSTVAPAPAVAPAADGQEDQGAEARRGRGQKPGVSRRSRRKERLAEVEQELATAQARHDELVELMAKPELYVGPGGVRRRAGRVHRGEEPDSGPGGGVGRADGGDRASGTRGLARAAPHVV